MWTRLSHFLQKGNSVSIYYKKLQVLATEMYKVSNVMSSTILKDIFGLRATPYSLCNPVNFKMWKVHSIYNSPELFPIYDQKSGS